MEEMEQLETATQTQFDPNFIDFLADFIQKGGVFMYVIIAVWLFGFIIALTRFKDLMKTLDVDGTSFMNELHRYILSNDIQGAIRVCSGSAAALPRVLKSGLKRASQSIDQVQNALDATALEVIPKVEKNLSLIPLMANICTLFGLLGTIFGLITAFGAIESADPEMKAKILSQGISNAMHTTAMGLICAIALMFIHAWLNKRAEKIVNEVDEFSVKLMDLLGTKKNETPQG